MHFIIIVRLSLCGVPYSVFTSIQPASHSCGSLTAMHLTALDAWPPLHPGHVQSAATRALRRSSSESVIILIMSSPRYARSEDQTFPRTTGDDGHRLRSDKTGPGDLLGGVLGKIKLPLLDVSKGVIRTRRSSTVLQILHGRLFKKLLPDY